MQTCRRSSEQIFEQAGQRFNLNSPKQLGDVLFNKMKLPKPLKYGKGKVVSTAQDVLEELAVHHPVAAQVLAYRQLAKLKSNYVDSLPLLADSEGRVHTTFNQVGTATGTTLIHQSKSAEHPHSHREGTGDPRRVHRTARACVVIGGLLADRAAADGALF